MTLPQRSEIKEDVLPLQRALRALDDAKRSLKQFSQTRSAKADPALVQSVDWLRSKVKKARNRTRTIVQRCATPLAILQSWLELKSPPMEVNRTAFGLPRLMQAAR